MVQTDQDQDLQAWPLDNARMASLEVIDEEDRDDDDGTCVHVNKEQRAQMLKDECMSDSGAGAGVDPCLQNFERMQPSKIVLLAANGSQDGQWRKRTAPTHDDHTRRTASGL